MTFIQKNLDGALLSTTLPKVTVKSTFGCNQHKPHAKEFAPVFDDTNGAITVEVNGLQITIKEKDELQKL